MGPFKYNMKNGVLNSERYILHEALCNAYKYNAIAVSVYVGFWHFETMHNRCIQTGVQQKVKVYGGIKLQDFENLLSN